MLCTHVRERIADFSVGILSGRESAEIGRHLEICADCREELHALERVASLVEEHGRIEPPPGLFNAVRNRIELGEVRRDRAPWWFWFNTRPARGVAMAMAVASVVVPLLLPVPPSASPMTELPMHGEGSNMPSSALASSIRQHAMSAGNGTLTDRVAWEAMAQLAAQEHDERGREVR